jgi:hypothetical protein
MLGIICEGGRTDGPVLEKLLKHHFPDLVAVVRPTTKAAIFSAAPELLDELAELGATHILVVWDLHPVGVQMAVNSQRDGEKPCRVDQQKTFLERAQEEENTLRGRVHEIEQRYGVERAEPATPDGPELQLVCFEESFDAVFLVDPSLLRTLASTDAHAAPKPPKVKPVDGVAKPQEVLRRYFGKAPSKKYKYFNKHTHSLRLAIDYIDAGKAGELRGHPAYDRLIGMIEGWFGLNAA